MPCNEIRCQSVYADHKIPLGVPTALAIVFCKQQKRPDRTARCRSKRPSISCVRSCSIKSLNLHFYALKEFSSLSLLIRDVTNQIQLMKQISFKIYLSYGLVFSHSCVVQIPFPKITSHAVYIVYILYYYIYGNIILTM